VYDVAAHTRFPSLMAGFNQTGDIRTGNWGKSPEGDVYWL
jgi:hypothetical protein